MIKGLRLAFAEELKGFGRGRWIRVLFRETGIYTFEQSQIRQTTFKEGTKENQTKAKKKGTKRGRSFRN